MPRYIYGVHPVAGNRELLDIIPDKFEEDIPDEMVKKIWINYQDIVIKTEKEPENGTDTQTLP